MVFGYYQRAVCQMKRGSYCEIFVICRARKVRCAALYGKGAAGKIYFCIGSMGNGVFRAWNETRIAVPNRSHVPVGGIVESPPIGTFPPKHFSFRERSRRESGGSDRNNSSKRLYSIHNLASVR
jgi:hypothetical protein